MRSGAPCLSGQPDPRDGRRSEHRSSQKTHESTRSRDRRLDPPIAVSRPSRDRLHHVTAARDPSRPARSKDQRAHAFANTPYHHRGTRCVHASAPAPDSVLDGPPLLLHQRLRQLPRDRRRRPPGDLPGLRLPSPAELTPRPQRATALRGNQGSPIIGRQTRHVGDRPCARSIGAASPP